MNTTLAKELVPNWRRHAALLNAVSGFAQIGQYGIAFPLLSLWLQARGASSLRIGVMASLVWVAMSAGIVAAPFLMRRYGPARTVLQGMVASALACAFMGNVPQVAWLILCPLLGWGFGLRWIGNESWLYSIVPEGRRGLVVGVHETVIGLSMLVGPLLIGGLGVYSPAAFWCAGVFCLLATLPLWPARASAGLGHLQAEVPRITAGQVLRGLWAHPVWVGFWAGVTDTAALSLFVVVAQDHGIQTSTVAGMLTVFGITGLVMQVPLGWLADRFGTRSAILVCSLFALAGAGLTLAAPLAPILMLTLAAGCFGVLGSGLLTLAMVLASQARGDIRLSMSQASLAFTVGSALGPALVGALMNSYGPVAYPWALAGAAALLICRVLREKF